MSEKQKPKRDPLYGRSRYLPHQLEAARKKVRILENEARRYGFTHLLDAPPS